MKFLCGLLAVTAVICISSVRAERTMTEKGYQLIREFEGCVLTAYQ